MHPSIATLIARSTLTALTVLAGPLLPAAVAQTSPGPAVEVAAGWVGFPDDGTVNEGLVGGALRWYVGPRIGIGPEVTYIAGNGHSHLMITGNVTFDLVAPGRRRVTPFLVVGGGVFQTRQRFAVDTFTSRESAFTAGGGVRTRVGDRVTIGLDARVGWELHLRVAGLVGINLGR